THHCAEAAAPRAPAPCANRRQPSIGCWIVHRAGARRPRVTPLLTQPAAHAKVGPGALPWDSNTSSYPASPHQGCNSPYHLKKLPLLSSVRLAATAWMPAALSWGVISALGPPMSVCT